MTVMLLLGHNWNFIFIAGTGTGPRSEFFSLPGPEPGRDQKNFIAGAGAGPGSKNFKCPGPGRDWKNLKCRGRAGIGIFLLPGPELGRDQKILNARGQAGTGKIQNAGAGPGSDFFYCRGQAGI